MSKTINNLRHARSQQDFPFLSLEEDEYVVLKISRSRAGLVLIWFTEVVLFLICTLALILVDSSGAANSFFASSMPIFRIVIFVVYIFLFLSGTIGTKVYLDNKVYITNRRVIQETSNALFSKSTNVIELEKIEDVSFRQSGILDYIFHFGTIRMATVGDETTYTFRFVDTPTDEVQTISHLITEAKKPKE